MRRQWLSLLSVALLVACSSGDTITGNNPIDPGNRLDITAPEVTDVTVGSNRVQLEWEAHPDESVDGTVIFRREVLDDPEVSEGFKKVGETDQLLYLDLQVRDNRTYEYKVAATRDGFYGQDTPAIEARPGFFTSVINNQNPVTNLAAVTVTFGGLPGTEAVQISEQSNFAGATWRAFSPSLSWTLSSGDGEKTVFSRLRFTDGTQSFPVFDTITLDTRALILSVSFEGADVRAPGETVRFSVDTGETNGQATVSVSGLFSNLALFDDGTNGDGIAGDGIHERSTLLPAGSSVTAAKVTGSYTDVAGNRAASVDGPRTLTVRKAPEPVSVLSVTAAPPPEAASVLVAYSQSTDGDFSSYRIFRDTTAEVTASDRLVATVNNRNTLEVRDSEAAEGVTYFYRVFVRTSTGLETGSNVVSIAVPNVRTPDAVTLNAPDGVSYTRITLDWSAAQDLDFSAYLVRRNLDGAVDASDPLVATITDLETTFFVDDGLTENTEYFYRVFVRDSAGFTTPSNERGVRTRNEAPPAVTLNAPTQVSASGATFSWSRSNAQDFKSYRLFRSESSGVTTGSTLVVEVANPDDLSFRDLGLTAGTTYFYRVFVDDEGPESIATGSNTVSITTSGTAP